MIADNIHPPAYLLDEIAAGNQDAATLAHLAECQVCQDYVAQLKRAAEAYEASQASETEAIVTRARAALVTPDIKSHAARRYQLIAASAVGLSLAAAAALLIRTSSQGEADLPLPGVPVSDSFESETETSLERESRLRFKGKLQVALIIARKGAQQRITHDVALQAGDAVRVEVSVDQPQALLVGFLGEDGTWIPLIDATKLEAGAHLSENALQFDAEPTPGRIIAGSPDAVRRARSTRNFAEVTTLVLSFGAKGP
jgi:hypothetical protein